MLIDKIDDLKKEVGKIAKQYEIYIEKDAEISLESENNKLNFAKEEISQGIGIRVIDNNKIGFAYTTDFSNIKQTTEQALANTHLNKQDPNFEFAMPSKKINVEGIYDKNYKNLNMETSIDLLNNIIETSEQRGCDVTTAGFVANESEIAIANSNGVNSSYKKTYFGLGLSVNIIDGENISTAYDSIYSTNFSNLNGNKLSEDVCNLAINSLGGEHVETDNYDVVLDYHALTGLLSTFIQAFSSENVERGRSILKGKEETEITSKSLSLIDDSTYKGGLGSRPFDGEGTRSCKTKLIEDGILKSFLYDIYSANKANCKSTSNASRNYSTTPIVTPSNLIFNITDTIGINEIKNGVLVSSVLGAHTANPITGDFSVEANNSFKIENGEISTPIKKAMISGNIFELLKTCKKVESEIRQYGPYIIPKILVRGLKVIGQN